MPQREQVDIDHQNDRMKELLRRRQPPKQGAREEQEKPERALEAQAAGLEWKDPQQPGKEEEKKKHMGYLRPQTFEEPLPEVFFNAKVEDPMMKREQFAIEARKSKKKELLSKKRYPPQDMQAQSRAYAPEESYFLGEDDGYFADGAEAQDAFTVDQYLNNP